MTDKEHLLVCLQEECDEIAQAALATSSRVAKALRFGLDEVQAGQIFDNATRIAEELGDLLAVVKVLGESGVNFGSMVAKKREKIGRFMEYASALGTLTRKP